jgi:tripartite-type tricarboxylate transporter receptor subunit TctC
VSALQLAARATSSPAYGHWLSQRLGQPFVIENRPGAGSNVATAAVVNAPPDGYTLLMIASANSIAATLYDKLNFDFVRDIAPVAGTNSNPYGVGIGREGKHWTAKEDAAPLSLARC